MRKQRQDRNLSNLCSLKASLARAQPFSSQYVRPVRRDIPQDRPLPWVSLTFSTDPCSQIMELAGRLNRNHINSRSFMKCATLLRVLAVPPLPQEKRTTQSRWINVTIEQG